MYPRQCMSKETEEPPHALIICSVRYRPSIDSQIVQAAGESVLEELQVDTTLKSYVYWTVHHCDS